MSEAFNCVVREVRVAAAAPRIIIVSPFLVPCILLLCDTATYIHVTCTCISWPLCCHPVVVISAPSGKLLLFPYTAVFCNSESVFTIVFFYSETHPFGKKHFFFKSCVAHVQGVSHACQGNRHVCKLCRAVPHPKTLAVSCCLHHATPRFKFFSFPHRSEVHPHISAELTLPHFSINTIIRLSVLTDQEHRLTCPSQPRWPCSKQTKKKKKELGV